MNRQVLSLVTRVAGALGSRFIVLFAVVESLVSETLEAWLGMPTLVGAALAGAEIALVVIPLRRRYTKWMAGSTPTETRSTPREHSPRRLAA